MGGAERNARKRKQQRAGGGQAVAKARGNDNRKTIAAVVAVVVLAAVVIGGVIWTNSASNDTEGQAIPVAPTEQELQYPGQRDGAAVVRGSADAKATIDVYEDFLCPYCGQFERKYGAQIEEKIAAGELRVRYHAVPFLVRASDPPGYSADAANATLAAADAGKFVAFHASLFAHQPEEGGRGYSKDQLIQLGRDIGITGDAFAQAVRSGKYDQQLTAALDKAKQNPTLQRTQGGRTVFSTPTVVADGKILSVFDNENWLRDLLTKNPQ